MTTCNLAACAVAAAVALAASLPLGAQGTTPPQPAAPAAPAARGAAIRPAAPATGWTKKTAWGDPDLQAIWNNGSATPVQRDPKYGTRTQLTQEEYQAALKTAEIRQQGETEEQRNDPARGVGAGPTFWYEVGKTHMATSLVIDPPDGRYPPTTPQLEAQGQERRRLATPEGARLDKSMWERQGVWVRCISRSLPAGMTPVVYNNNFQIVQAPGVVVVHQEMIHTSRIIQLDGRPPLDPAIRQWNGDARGHWEGNTLVVETTNIHPLSEPLWPTNMNSMGVPYKLTERFTRTSATDLDYQWTLDAPSMFTKPITASIPASATAAPDRITEYACVEGDNAVRLTITGLLAQIARGEKTAEPPQRGRGAGAAPPGARRRRAWRGFWRIASS